MTSVLIVGAGDRGTTYARWIAAHPETARVVAVAEPHDGRRRALGALVGGGVEEYAGWEEAVAAGRVADVAIICTQDRQHAAPALALLAQGYHVLLEKPMAPTLAESERIARAAEEAGVVFGVCHVMRYMPHTAALRRLLGEGAIGRVQSVQHLEPIGWYHFAHSYVRGNWAREADSAPALLAKSCHDIDWLPWVIGAPIERVSSFGSRRYFRAEEAPDGATERCLDCPLQATCAYSATRIYLERARSGEFGWPVAVITDEPTVAGTERALREGPYGRCVWHCDNDVVDRQVVALELAGGVTVTFQMIPFTDMGPRRTQVFGEFGELTTDGHTIEVFDFRTQQRRRVEVEVPGSADAGGGHDGGDAGLLEAFFAAVATHDPDAISSGPAESLASHAAVFAIERARLEGCVVEL